MSDIELGYEVQDITTGFKGIVTERLEHLDGSLEYGVRHSKTPNEPPRVTYIAACYLKKTGDGVHVVARPRVLGFGAGIVPDRVNL